MKLKLSKLLILSLLVLGCMTTVIFADGEGSNSQFALESANPTDGQKNVPIDSKIQLNFNKNVVNILVKDNNYNCFRLLNQEGQAIPIDVLMADDQIERDKRREIILKPKEQLNYGKKYTVIISKELMSKSGASLGKDITFFFTTAPEKSSYSSVIWIVEIVAAFIIAAVYLKRKRA